MVKLLKLLGSCFIVAVMVYSLYVGHLELLSSVFKEGYNYGVQQCAKPSTYIYPKDDYEGI